MCLQACLLIPWEKYSYFKGLFGLRSGYSSNYPIVNLAESIKKYIDNDNCRCSVFIDLEKAFDTVDHQILSQKLYHYGIRCLVHKWFGSYVSNRQEFVYTSGSSSELMSIKCGVPQVSTLGPLFCLLYINDLNPVFNKVKTIHFADDNHLNYESKKLSTINSVMNYELKKIS